MPGATVYGADGEKVGTVAGAGGSYIVVEKGFFFPKDYYIPVSSITDSNENAVHLSVTKDDALNQGWDQEPADLGWNGEQTAQGWSDASVETPVATAQHDERVGQAEYAEQDTLRVPVHEEHLSATTRQAEAGEVTISKQVVEQQETIEVPVTEEHVRVEWRTPTGEVSTDGEVFEEGVIEVPVSREVVDVSKRTVQTGELEVTKEREQRTQRVTDSVRREIVDVEDTTDETMRTSR
jgi:uncharacterized protein (TIGR02271 family)